MANKNPRIIVKGKKWLISPMVIIKKKILQTLYHRPTEKEMHLLFC
jgi:hypothetical protein